MKVLSIFFPLMEKRLYFTKKFMNIYVIKLLRHWFFMIILHVYYMEKKYIYESLSFKYSVGLIKDAIESDWYFMESLIFFWRIFTWNRSRPPFSFQSYFFIRSDAFICVLKTKISFRINSHYYNNERQKE